MSNFSEILSLSIDRMLAGATLGEVVAADPQHADALTPTLRDVQLVLRSGPPVEASAAARAEATRGMNAQLALRGKTEEFVAAFMRRPAPFRLAAIAGGIALFGALGAGVAAATGNTPPVREILSGADSLAMSVEFDGVITAIDPAAETFAVRIGDDERPVRVVASTELSRGGDTIGFGQFVVGDAVEVKGALQVDDTIIATRVHLEDGDRQGDDGASAPDATASDDRDNSGPGDGDAGIDENGEHEDRSGPGDGVEDEDSSGPGNGDAGEDNSGPGDDADDETGDDDNSGTGDGDDEEDDGNSGDGEEDDDD